MSLPVRLHSEDSTDARQDRSCLPFCSCGTCGFCERRNTVLRSVEADAELARVVKHALLHGDYLPVDVRDALAELDQVRRA